MGGCPLLGPLDTRCCIILRTQDGTIMSEFLKIRGPTLESFYGGSYRV